MDSFRGVPGELGVADTISDVRAWSSPLSATDDLFLVAEVLRGERYHTYWYGSTQAEWAERWDALKLMHAMTWLRSLARRPVDPSHIGEPWSQRLEAWQKRARSGG